MCVSSLCGTGGVCQFCFVLPLWSSYKWEEHQHPVLAPPAGRPCPDLLRDSNKASCLRHHRGSSVYEKPGVPCLSCDGYMEVSLDRRWCKITVFNLNFPLKLSAFLWAAALFRYWNGLVKSLKKNVLIFHTVDAALKNVLSLLPLFHVIFLLVSRKIRRLFYWKPEPRRLLTEEEYREQGEEETRRALEELRRQCNSPEFSPWKMVSRLQSPQRWLLRF